MKKNEAWKNIRFFSWDSIFFKYLLSMFFIILIVFVPYIISINQYSNTMLEKEISMQASDNIIKSKKIFDLLTSGFTNNYALVSDDEDVMNFLSASEIATQKQSVERCQKMLKAMQGSDLNYEDVMLYSTINQHYVTTKSIVKFDKNTSPLWINTYRSTRLPFIMFPRKLHSDHYDTIFTVQEIYNSAGVVVGIFAIQMNYSEFQNLVKQSFEEESAKIYIVSDIGLILYSNDSSRINTIAFEHPVIYPAFQATQQTSESSLFWKNYIISVARSNNSKLLLMAFYDKDQMMGNYDLLKNMIELGSITVLVAAIICSLFIAFDHYRSVSNVLKVIKNPANSAALKYNSKFNNEISYIIHFLISSADQKHQLNDALTQKIKQLQQAQLCELQAQINPHFIFNTLQSINLSILRETHQDTPSTKMISLFSELLRSVYDTDHIMVPMGEEVENIKKFIEIQSMRYKGRLHVKYEIDDSCLSFYTLKMIFQPLVENCIVHGFRSSNQEWELSIRCTVEKGYLVINIADNGNGISIEQLKKIRERIQSTDIYGQNIGISNVSQRLKLLFDDDYLICIDSKLGQGTSITIRHPATTNHPIINFKHKLNNM